MEERTMEIRRANLSDLPAVYTCCTEAFKDYIPLIGRALMASCEDLIRVWEYGFDRYDMRKNL